MQLQDMKQPKALYYLFVTEMWERFSYYGMRAILVLYMTKGLLFDDSLSYITYGTFTAFAYMTPVLGGYLADRCLGYVRAVAIGAIFIVCGHLSLSLPITVHFLGGHFLFYLGLSLIIVGTGFFKANVSSIVGKLYGENDNRRDAGFTIFYMGVNLGAFLASILVAVIAQAFGWHAGFSLAAIGMFFGLIVFRRANHMGIFPKEANEIRHDILHSKFCSLIKIKYVIYALSIVAVLLSVILLAKPKGSQTILIIFGVGTLIYLMFQIISSSKKEKAGIFMVIILSFISMFFWAFFEQAGSSITLFTDRVTDRTYFGYAIPTGAFQALNAFFIIACAPVMSWVWLKLAKRKIEPNISLKFAMGLIFLAVGFGFLALGAYLAFNDGHSSAWWVVLAYFFHTIGELCLSPIGLSAVTKYSPVRLVGLLMGTWFLATAFAEYIAGVIATFTATSSSIHHTNVIQGYYGVFYNITVVALVVGIIVLAASYWMNKIGKIAEEASHKIAS